MTFPMAPPQNIEAEQRVLGTLLAYYKPELVVTVQAAGVKWSDFYRESHRVVYRAILKMNYGREWVDTLTVARFLECQPHPEFGSWLEAIGGQARLEELVCSAQVNGLRECARIVAEDGKFRRWLGAMFDGLEALHARDEAGFWAAMASIREDVLPEPLRVIEGGDDERRAA